MKRSDLKESCADGTGESVDHDIEHMSWTDEQGRLMPSLEHHAYSVASSNHDGDSIPACKRIHKLLGVCVTSLQFCLMRVERTTKTFEHVRGKNNHERADTWRDALKWEVGGPKRDVVCVFPETHGAVQCL